MDKEFEMRCYSYKCTGKYCVDAKGVVKFVNEKKSTCPDCKSILVKKIIGKKQERRTKLYRFKSSDIDYGLRGDRFELE